LARAPIVCVKPIETGVRRESITEPGAFDAAALESACFNARAPRPHPLFAFPAAVSPHRAARLERREIDLERIPDWLRSHEATLHDNTWLFIESAGGVFSPLTRDATNLDLALLLEPALWLLVAPDALGVLHDLSTTLCAMRARARAPDVIVLSAARAIDESTGGNLEEATELGIAKPVAALARDDEHGVEAAVDALLAMSSAAAQQRSR
jgi:dethiobiotin synthetase